MPIAKLLPTILIAAVFVVLANNVDAQDSESILNFSASSSGGGIGFNNGLFGTFDDGDTTTIGNQTSPVQFDNFLSPLTDISVGSVTISGVMLTNNAQVVPIAPSTILVSTIGGEINVYDDNNDLLLSGDLGEQSLSGSEVGGSTAFSSGSFASSGNAVNTGIIFTGGSLLPFLDANSGGLSIDLIDIRTNGAQGLSLSNGEVLDFTANATGQIFATPSGAAASSVPEPSTLPLLLFGLALFSGARKRSSV